MTDGFAADRALTHPQAGPPKTAQDNQAALRSPPTRVAKDAINGLQHAFLFFFPSSLSVRRTSVSHPAERTAKSQKPENNNAEAERGRMRRLFRSGRKWHRKTAHFG